MNRPRLLDLYCCLGGASRGYEYAGFDVFGVDIFRYRNEKGQMAGYRQDQYPYPAVRAGAVQTMEWLLAQGAVPFAHPATGDTQELRLSDFAAVHASPPCQHASAGTRALRKAGTHVYDKWIDPTREVLIASGKPYVIENVKGAALINPVMLCGRQFGLTAVDDDGVVLHLDRHRMFETNWNLTPPPTCQPHDTSLQVGGSYGGARRDKHEARHERHGGYVPAKHVQQELLGIDWMPEAGMYQALPPAYCRYVGAQLLTEVYRARRQTQTSTPTAAAV